MRRTIGTIRQRSEHSWEGRYYENGKRKSIYGKTEDEARDKLYDIYTAILKGNYNEPPKENLEQWAWYWFSNYVEPIVRYSTTKNYEGYLINHIIPELGSLKLQDITTDILQEFFVRKYDGGRADGHLGGLTPKTLTNIKNMLHMMLNKPL